MTTTPNPTPTSQILDAAADLIREQGWWQSGGELEGMPLCAGNAITKASLDAGASLLPATRAFYAYLDGQTIGAIWDWNDTPDRTEAEVVAALRSCALLEAAREEAATHAPADRHEVAL